MSETDTENKMAQYNIKRKPPHKSWKKEAKW